MPFLIGASSLLARIEHIGEVDQGTGQVELRFYIYGTARMVSISKC